MLITFMTLSVFAALPLADATVYSETNNWDIYIGNDPLSTTLYPGEQNVGFSVTIVNGNAGSDTADLNGCNLYIQTTTIRNETGATVTSPIANWDNTKDEWGNTINEGASHTFTGFQFDLIDNPTPGTYNLTIDMQFTDSDGTPSGTQHFTGYILFDIANNIAVADATPALYAGQTYTEQTVSLTPAWTGITGINNLYLNLSNIPAGITFYQMYPDDTSIPGTTFWAPGTINGGGIDAVYRVDVARNMTPGVYSVDYVTQYTNPDNIRCTENGALDIAVEFTPVIEAEVVGSTTIVTSPGADPIPVVEVRFTNTGTVGLTNIDITQYWGIDFYEPAAPGGYPTSITDVQLHSLAKGETTSDSWYVPLDAYAGQDRILFDWSADYLDTGVTGNGVGNKDVSCTWSGTPLVPVYHIGVVSVNPWIAGAYVLATDLSTNTIVEDPDESLYAGDTFADQTVTVKAYWGDISDVYLNISGLPAGITFDETSAHIPNIVTTAGTDVVFRADVARTVAPGIYPVHYRTEYTNGTGGRLADTGTFNLTVEFTPIIEAEVIDSVTIIQGNASIPALQVRFNNTGNVDLRNIEIWPELDGTFFYSAVDFYEGADGSTVQNPQMVDTIQIDSLAQGANTSDSWFIALDPYVQAGQHRILFDWTASFFDNGATGNDAHYVDVTGGWWDDDWDDTTPMLPVCDVNPGTEWIAGAYVMVSVNDDHPDFTADKMMNEDRWDDYFDLSNDNLVYVMAGTNINNFEWVKFTDLRATLQVGEGTPFLNPLNHSAPTVENDFTNSAHELAARNAGGPAEAGIVWFVDVDPNAAPGLYVVNITVTGRNADTGQDISVTTQSVVEVRGFGPELLVTSVTTGDINPGQQFTMNLTITNQGDDTARDVFVSIPDSFIFNGDPSQYWNVLDGFVSSISTYRDDYSRYNNSNSDFLWNSTWSPAYNNNTYSNERETIMDNSNITLEQLNIKDAKDIVDLNLYIEGVYTHPAPTIWMVKASSLAPGESVTVSFQMVSNANMAPGRPYVIPVQMHWVDSTGGPDGMHGSVTVQSTGTAEPYHATAGSQILTSDNALGWGFLAVILVLIGVLAWMFGPRKKEEEPMYQEEKPAAWDEPTPESQKVAEEESKPWNEPTPESQEEQPQEESIPEIAELSADEPAAVDAPAPSEETPSDEVPLVYDEKEPESF